jgi:hypothetical protein
VVMMPSSLGHIFLLITLFIRCFESGGLKILGLPSNVPVQRCLRETKRWRKLLRVQLLVKVVVEDTNSTQSVTRVYIWSGLAHMDSDPTR